MVRLVQFTSLHSTQKPALRAKFLNDQLPRPSSFAPSPRRQIRNLSSQKLSKFGFSEIIIKITWIRFLAEPCIQRCSYFHLNFGAWNWNCLKTSNVNDKCHARSWLCRNWKALIFQYRTTPHGKDHQKDLLAFHFSIFSVWKLTSKPGEIGDACKWAPRMGGGGGGGVVTPLSKLSRLWRRQRVWFWSRFALK